MRIDALAARADRAGRHTVTFSDGSVMRLYLRTIEDFGLFVGLELTDEEMKTLKTAAEKMSAKMRAVRIVAASNVSKTDLEQRLIRKGESKTSAREAVQWMSDLNLVDDAETARQLVQQCIRKGYGVARAKQALYEKRIPKTLWEDALADYPDMTDTITAYLQSHLQGSQDQKQQKKQWMRSFAEGTPIPKSPGRSEAWIWILTNSRRNFKWQTLDLFPLAARKTRWIASG